jgi:capsular polysaccharide transport system permease protein
LTRISGQTIKKNAFLFYVGGPTLLAALFYGVVASPVFVSVGSLVVYKASHRVPGIVAMLSGSAGGGSLEGGYVLKNYVKSWTEFKKIDRKINLAKSWSHGDFVSRYGGLWGLYQENDVALWHYYQNHVQVSVNTTSGIVSVRVLGPNAQFAADLGKRILTDSVAHIDEMNHQEEVDYMARAVSQRRATEGKLDAVEHDLAAYRARIGIYDPKALYVSQLSYLENLKEEEVKVEAQFDTLASATPNNPVGRNLQAAISALREKVSTAQDSFSKLSRDAAGYDPLVVAEANEISLLQQVNVAVQEAELNGDKNKYYLDVISGMSSPRTAELPHRILDTFYVFLLSFVFWIFAR